MAAEGLSEKLLEHFSYYIEYSCPTFDPYFSLMCLNWIVGFMNADGSFGFTVKDKAEKKVVNYIEISQHEISLKTLNSIISFLKISGEHFQKKQSV